MLNTEWLAIIYLTIIVQKIRVTACSSTGIAEKLIAHPYCTSDLAQCNFFLFATVKDQMSELLFRNDEETRLRH